MPNFNDRRPGYSGGDLPDKFNCPSCGGFIPNNETPGAYPGAISRKDGKTEICSNCGTLEAFQDYFNPTDKSSFSSNRSLDDFKAEEIKMNYGSFSWDKPNHYADKEEPNPYDENVYDEETGTYECPNCGVSGMSRKESSWHKCNPDENENLT